MKYIPTSKNVASQGQKNGRTWTKWSYEGTDENGKVVKVYMFDDLEPGKEYDLEQYETQKDGKTYQNYRIAKPDPLKDLAKVVDDLAQRVGSLERGMQVLSQTNESGLGGTEDKLTNSLAT